MKKENATSWMLNKLKESPRIYLMGQQLSLQLYVDGKLDFSLKSSLIIFIKKYKEQDGNLLGADNTKNNFFYLVNI